MKDCGKTVTPTFKPVARCPAPPLVEGQPAGNQAAIDGMVAEAPSSGFFDALDLSGPEPPGLFDWAVSEEQPASPDEGLLDYLGLGELPSFSALSPHGSAEVGIDGVEARLSESETTTDALLGDDSTRIDGLVQLGKDGNLRAGVTGRESAFGGDLAVSGGGMVGQDGRLDVGGQVELLGNEFGIQGMVDFDGVGGVEAVGGSVSVKTGDIGLSAGGAYQLESVKLQGNTVSWSSGYSAEMGAEVGGVGGSRDRQRGEQQSRTFRTAKEAQDFVDRLGAGDAPDNRELRSADLIDMAPGTRIRYADTAVDGVKVGLVGELGENVQRERDVEISRGEGNQVQILVRENVDHEGVFGVGNGVMGVDASAGRTQQSSMEYALDLSQPADIEAFDMFQRTGQMPESVPIVQGEELDGFSASRGAAMPGLSVKQSGTIQSGQVVEDGVVSEVVRGSSAEDVSQGSRYDIPVGLGSLLENAGVGMRGLGNQVGGSGLEILGQELESWGAERREQQFQGEGSQNGSEYHLMTVRMPEGEDGEDAMTIDQRQVLEFEDVRQTARVLQDQVTPEVDAQGIDPSMLPDPAVTDRKWILDSVINEEGTANIAEKFSKGYGFDFEFGAARVIEEIKQDYRSEGETAEAFAEAMAQLGYQGGEDAFEGVRDIAGEENVERYLKLEGDDMWIGKERNASLDRSISEAISRRDENPIWFDETMREIRDSEFSRLAQLRNSKSYPEVPEALRHEEIERLIDRVARIEGER